MDWPRSVYYLRLGWSSLSNNDTFWARVKASPVANRYKYFRKMNEDSLILIYDCLNCLCSYSKRMIRAMYINESENRVMGGKVVWSI